MVEPPGGSSVRRLAPFYEDRSDPNGSLYWWAYNRNKRAITLDFTAPEGRALFLQMVAGADFLIDPQHQDTTRNGERCVESCQLPELDHDSRFSSIADRLAHAGELDRIVARWT